MSRREMLRAVALGVLLALSGCCQARIVMSDQYGGVVAIPNNSNSWPTYYRDHAKELMDQKCPQGYVIEQEAEFVTGHSSTTHIEGSPNATADQRTAMGRMESTTDVRDLTEWRITFRSKDAPASLPPLRFGSPGKPPVAPTVVIPFTPTEPNPELPSAPVPVPQRP